MNETRLGELEEVDFSFRQNSGSSGIRSESGNNDFVRAVVPFSVDITSGSKVGVEGNAMETVFSGFRVRLRI